MSNPQVHAERSANRWGGTPEDYLKIHQWFDATKAHVADNRHRMVLHNGFGIALAEQVFGVQLVNSAGKRVFVRDIGEQHVLEDLGCIPSLAECLKELPVCPWMAGARKALQGVPRAASQDGAGGGVQHTSDNRDHVLQPNQASAPALGSVSDFANHPSCNGSLQNESTREPLRAAGGPGSAGPPG